jgi:hypothetical protein
MSIGNVRNSVRQAHRGAVVSIAFLAIPKSTSSYSTSRACYSQCSILATKEDSEDPDFRNFRRQIFHSSLLQILSSLRPGMTTPEVVQCPNNHFQRAVYGVGPYIANYPEQVLLSCIVQGWCPRYVFEVVQSVNGWESNFSSAAQPTNLRSWIPTKLQSTNLVITQRDLWNFSLFVTFGLDTASLELQL